MLAGGVGKEQVLFFFFLPFLSGICIGVYS